MNDQVRGGPLEWKAVKTRGYYESGGVFSALVTGLTLLASMIGLGMMLDEGSPAFGVMFLVPFIFAVFFILVSRAAYKGKRVLHSSVGIIVCAGVIDAKRIVTRTLSTESIDFDILSRRPNPFQIDFDLKEGSGAYSIDGGRFYVLAVSLNAPGAQVKTTTAILMGPVSGNGARYVGPLSKGIGGALAHERVWTLPLDNRIEDYQIPSYG